MELTVIGTTETLDISIQPAVNRFAAYMLEDIKNNPYKIMDSFFSCAFILSAFGIASNVINLIVFFKQGLDTTMNISFFALAISDLLSLATLQVIGFIMNPLIVDGYELPWNGNDVAVAICGWPHTCFSQITSCITVYITAERYACIVFPLKIKELITPRRTAMLLGGIFALNVVAMIPDYSSMYLDWRFFPEKNRTLLSLNYRAFRQYTRGVGNFMLGMIAFTSFPGLIFFTTALIIKMKRQIQWRNSSTSDGKQADTIAKRDVKAINMVLVVAIVLIACYTPGMMTAMATCFVQGFNFESHPLAVSIYGLIFLLEAVNSSVNIFLYYRMSSKYRDSFQELFKACISKRSMV